MPNPEPLIEIFDDASPTGMRVVLHHRGRRRDLAGFRCRESVCVTAIDRIDLVVCLPVLVVLHAVCLTL